MAVQAFVDWPVSFFVSRHGPFVRTGVTQTLNPSAMELFAELLGKSIDLITQLVIYRIQLPLVKRIAFDE
jgi:hypothetical protein